MTRKPSLRKVAAAQDRLTRLKGKMTRIRGRLDAMVDDYLEGLREEDWKTLGCPNVAAWRDAILDGLQFGRVARQRIVKELTARGWTQRRIAAATGAGTGTISRDQTAVGAPGGAQATARQKAARDREAARTGSPAPRRDGYRGSLSMALYKIQDRNRVWEPLDLIRVDTHDLADTHAWTITVPAEARDLAAQFVTTMRKHADELTTVAKLLDQAAEPAARTAG
jgi:hypothetical protein